MAEAPPDHLPSQTALGRREPPRPDIRARLDVARPIELRTSEALPGGTISIVSRGSEDWYGVLKGLVEGDAEAFFRVSQLVTGVLRGTRAYDIESDWSDVLQDVAMATVDAMREGRLEASDNVVGFVRQIARHKIYDRLRRRTRGGAGKTTSLDDAPPDALADRSPTDSGDLLDLRRSLERLPEAERKLVVAVYGERRTYEEASKELGIPLGTAKRLLRQGMARLRKRFSKGEQP